MRIPFLRPQPPRLSDLIAELKAIESSGIFTNFGPTNARFEAALTEQIFAGLGGCVTVNCATTGLILAIREAAGDSTERRYALMPSFSFAATAHAAIWAGLTPLLCDIDEHTWAPCAKSEDRLLRSYEGQIACIVPYATFGNCIDLERYATLARRHGVGVVVDAAASLGSIDENGRGFGAGFPHALVYSMHATKVFATAEAGVIHCGDAERLARLRAMGNFGFAQPRVATLPGLNSKLSEIGALLGLAKLSNFDEIVRARGVLADTYKSHLPGFAFQKMLGSRTSHMFMPTLLPLDRRQHRGALVHAMKRRGIDVGHYFSPHIAEHPYFANVCQVSDLAVTQEVAERSLSLPMSDTMTAEQVKAVCTALVEATEVTRFAE